MGVPTGSSGLLEVHRYIVGGTVPHHRGIAAAGLSLAVAGFFISAPQYANADASASASAGWSTSAHALSAARSAAAGRGAQVDYRSFSSSASTPGRTRTGDGDRSLATRALGAKAASATTSSIIYVQADPDHCTKELGAGTLDDPYCLLQSAVNAAASGATIEVWQNDDEVLSYNEHVTISGKSNLTIVGEGVGIGDASTASDALDIKNSSGITVRNLVLDAGGGSAVDIVGSHGVILDADYMLVDGGGAAVVNITGTSSNVTVSRSTAGQDTGGDSINVEAGASNIVIASDVIYTELEAGVIANGVSTLDVVGNTIERGCSGSVIVNGASTEVSVEDNVFEAGGPSIGVTLCNNSIVNLPYAADVVVAAAAAPGTTSDYNDFTFGAANGTAAYAWAGTTYSTLAAFQAAVSQGAHDAVDPTADDQMFLTPAGVNVNTDGTSPTVDAQPVGTSLSIGSANVSAPGRLSTDFYGRGSYADRGALEYVTPSVAAAVTIYQTGARTVEAYADTSVEPDAYATYSYDWGDGNTAGPTTRGVASQTYANLGEYTVTVTVTDVFGDKSSATVSAQTAGSDFVPVTPTRMLDTRNGTGVGTAAPIASSQTLALQVAGVGQIPANATAVALNLTATDATASGHINAYPAGVAVPISSNLNFTTGRNVANMAVVPVGTGGVVDFYNGSAGTVDLIADVSGYFVAAQADGYKQVVPARILDTRTTTGGHHAPLTPSDPVKLKVTGVGGVPADATAVEVNLTVASGTANSLVTAYPDGTTQPKVSNLNFSSGQAIANAAIVPIGADGDIDIVTPVGSNRMIVDVDGYFSANTGEAPSAYEPVTPYRYLDSRTIKNGALDAHYFYHLPLGQDWWGNVDSAVTGVVTNTTVTSVTATSGDLDVFPDNYVNGNLDVPTISSLNFTKGATVPNLVFSTPGTDGNVDFLNNSAGSLQLVVDVFGVFQSS